MTDQPANQSSQPAGEPAAPSAGAKKPKNRRTDPRGPWVKATVIARMFDVSLASVYAGEAGMDQIRSEYLTEARTGGGRRTRSKRARRFYLPDAEALSKRMLTAAERKANPLPEPIARLFRGRRRRRIGSTGLAS